MVAPQVGHPGELYCAQYSPPHQSHLTPMNIKTDQIATIHVCKTRRVSIYLKHMLTMGVIMTYHTSTPTRHVKIFKNGHNQAIRIPRVFELPGNEALMHREGNRLIIEPVRTKKLSILLANWQPLHEGFPDILDQPPDPVDLE